MLLLQQATVHVLIWSAVNTATMFLHAFMCTVTYFDLHHEKFWWFSFKIPISTNAC